MFFLNYAVFTYNLAIFLSCSNVRLGKEHTNPCHWLVSNIQSICNNQSLIVDAFLRYNKLI